MSRANLWPRLKSLEGRTLRTVTGEGAFDVLRVAYSTVRIQIRTCGREQCMLRREFEAADGLGLRGDDLTPRHVRTEGASEYQPAYVAALLWAVDGDTRGLG